MWYHWNHFTDKISGVSPLPRFTVESCSPSYIVGYISDVHPNFHVPLIHYLQRYGIIKIACVQRVNGQGKSIPKVLPSLIIFRGYLLSKRFCLLFHLVWKVWDNPYLARIPLWSVRASPAGPSTLMILQVGIRAGGSQRTNFTRTLSFSWAFLTSPITLKGMGMREFSDCTRDRPDSRVKEPKNSSVFRLTTFRTSNR